MFLYEGLGQSVAMFTAEFQAKLAAFAAGKTTRARGPAARDPAYAPARRARVAKRRA